MTLQLTDEQWKEMILHLFDYKEIVEQNLSELKESHEDYEAVDTTIEPSTLPSVAQTEWRIAKHLRNQIQAREDTLASIDRALMTLRSGGQG